MAGSSAAVAAPDPDDLLAVRGVAASRVGGRATFVVQLEVPAPQHAALSAPADYPLVGPRAAALIGARLHRFERAFSLVPSDAASAAFTALDDAPSDDALGGAMRLTRAAEGWWLGVLRTERAALSLEVVFDAPTCAFDGHRYVPTPVAWAPHLPADAWRRPDAADLTALLAACPPGRDEGLLDLGPVPPIAADTSGQRVAVTGQHVTAGDGTLADVELTLDPRLAEVPPDLQTVLIFDGSWSAAPTIAGQLAAAQAYLAAAPATGRAAALVVNREVVRTLGWQRPATLARALDERWLQAALGNGSNLDVGLAAAGKLLGGRRGTSRVLAFTDGLVASRLAWAAEHPPPATLPARAALLVVHAAVDGRPALFRDDGALFGGWVAAHGGLALTLAGTGATGDAPLDVDQLLRPRTLDDVWLDAPGWHVLDGGAPCLPLTADAATTLDAGRSCRWLGEATAPAAPITVRAASWHRPWARVVELGRADAPALARDLLTRNVIEAGDPRRTALLPLAGSVTEEQALLVTWGGHGGDGPQAGGGPGYPGATCDCDAPGTIGHGTVVGTGRAAPVADALDLDDCAPTADGAETRVHVEATGDELVAVEVTAERRGRRVRSIETCVTRWLWASRLPFLDRRARFLYDFDWYYGPPLDLPKP